MPLLQVASLALLDDPAAQAQDAYTGRHNPAAGAAQGARSGIRQPATAGYL
ncbi:MAG TPA: hypothetical protein VKT25_08730 [Ktedonobacteraceae bacterium]|nr:hypothetical protein [Ktedonobacteraceae bacterium]